MGKETENISTNVLSQAQTTGDVGDGWVLIDMNERFLYKNNCITHAKIIILNNYITGMTEQEIAEEIFAHAVCYYWYDSDGNFFTIILFLLNYILMPLTEFLLKVEEIPQLEKHFTH